jgi:hypothetical protein
MAKKGSKPMSQSAMRSMEIKKKIARFCIKPRTLEEVKKKFSLSGISASAYLSWMLCNGVCDTTGKGKKKTYLKRKVVRAGAFK